MTFIRKKEIPPRSGNWYQYEVKTVMENGKKRQKVVRYLGKLGTPTTTREYSPSICKTDHCKYAYKQVPRHLWIPGDGIWECPECGYGIAPFEKKDFRINDDY